MGTLRPIIGEIQSEGDAFELDPRVREQLEGMGLTGEQIDFVVMLAQRLASRPSDAARSRGDARSESDAIRRRIEVAVKRGEMTRDEADAAYRRIRERMAGRRDR